jgi:hypothetical protein
MTTSRLALLLLFLFVGVPACSGNAQTSARASEAPAAATAGGDSLTITAEQMAATGRATAYDVVEKQHRRWLRDQLSGKNVTVYEDDQSVGGAEKLRTYPVRDVAELKYIDGQSAVRRWGPGVEGGVIVVTRNRN